MSDDYKDITVIAPHGAEDHIQIGKGIGGFTLVSYSAEKLLLVQSTMMNGKPLYVFEPVFRGK